MLTKKESQDKYNHGEKGLARKKKYEKSERGKEAVQKYKHSSKGKIVRQKTDKKRYRNYRDVMHRLKINGCAICGYSKCDRALDFHHTNPQDKKFNVNTCGIERKDRYVKEELNKCILLCKNCHSEIHDKN